MEIPARKPLRLWPGVVIAILLGLLRFVVPVVVPDSLMYSVLGGLVGGLLVPVWWLFLSRAPWSERLGAIALMIVALFATKRIVHESIAGGAMGFLFPFLAIPVLGLAFVGWAVATRRLPDGLRRATLPPTILAAVGSVALIRTGGFTASFQNDLHWRWTKTPEERLLAKPGIEPAAPPPTVPEAAEAVEAAEAPEKQPAGLPARPGPPPHGPGGGGGGGGGRGPRETPGGAAGGSRRDPPAGHRKSGDGSRLARLSRTASRQRHPRSEEHTSELQSLRHLVC